MNDVWLGPDLTLDDHDAFLTALALDPRNGAPLLAVADGEGERVRLVMASHAFFTLFGVSSGEALSTRLLEGRDPGSRRLAELSRALPLGGAPRLERLRFLLGPGSEVITFLCRRLRRESGRIVFIAAALGVRPGLMSSPAAVPRAMKVEPASNGAAARTPEPPAPETLASVPAIQAMLAARSPGGRRVRFVWQCDADGICREMSEPLAAIVGDANGGLVGKSLPELAPRLDPSGRLAEALAARATWSGVDVEWPIADAAGAVVVGLGAVPMLDRERAFAGFRGYGVIHLDRVAARPPMRLVPAPIPPGTPGNVVPFPGGAKGFSVEDHATFAALGAELRDRAGLAVHEGQPAPGEPSAEVAPPAQASALEIVHSEHAANATPVAAPAPVRNGPPAQHEEVDGARPAPAVAASPEPIAAAGEAPVPASMPSPSAPATHGETALSDASVPALPLPREPADNGLAVLDKVPLGLLVSRDNVPIFANRHLLDMLGFADEDALHEAGGLAHLFGGHPGLDDTGVRDRDGATIPAATHLRKIVWDGLPATLLTLQPGADPGPAARLEAEHAAAIEAMTRQSAEDRRRDAGELRHLRAILETAADGVAVIDADGKLISLNRSGEALFGRDRGTMVGRPFIELFAQEHQKLAEDYLHGLTTNATRSLFNDGREILVKAPQGGTIPVFMTLGRLDTGQPQAPEIESARYCALFRDLTHWKKVETELETARSDAEAASAAKTDFLAKVSHEVRTPLNAIIGFAEVILEERFGPVGSDRYRDYLRDIHASGTHVLSLINDLLDLSKIEAGRMELDPKPIDANAIISECVGLMQPQASRERVIMRLSLAPRLPKIKADERSLRQIVLNLLSNAVKYNEPGGQVIVATAAPEDGKVVIRIRDTGAGMSEADIAAALEPFRQVSSRPLIEGTGLGLPLTKALVEANEATFQIRSKLDHGTLIEVAFPPARVLAGQR